MPTHLRPQVPEAVRRIANAPDRRLAWEFFVFFSRFEYALKRDRRFLMPGTGDAQPSWDRFASDSNAAFRPEASPQLKAAVDYYLAQPPRKQVRANGEMSWSAPQAWDGQEPLLIWLLRAVRAVRNNLFHGGKFPVVPIAEPSRDRDLLTHGLAILGSALTMDPQVHRHFEEGLE